MDKIVLYMQTDKPLSGVHKNYLDILCYLADEMEYETYYINNFFAEDFENHKSTKNNFIDINECDYSQFEDAIFLAPANYVFFLMEHISALKNARISLLCSDASIVERLSNQLKKSKSDFVSLIPTLKYSDCCIFANRLSLIGAYKKGLKNVNCDYLPQTIINANNYDDSVEFAKNTKPVSETEINIGWLGPISPAALNVLKKLSNDLLDNYNSKGEEMEDGTINCDNVPKINIHVIGNGSVMWNMDFSKYSPAIRFIYTGELRYEEYLAYLRRYVDVAFCVNENVLSAASCGIPVLIPIYQNKMTNTDKYVYLFNNDSYNLRWSEDELWTLSLKTTTISDIVEDIYTKNLKSEYALRCLETYNENYSLTSCANNLIKSITKNSLTVKKLTSVKGVKEHLSKFRSFVKKYSNKTYRDFLNYLNGQIPDDNVTEKEVVKEAPTKKSLKSFIKKNTPNRILNHKFYSVQGTFKKKEAKIRKLYRKNGKIKVAFILVFNSVFPTRPVFEYMLNTDDFEPYIIIAPNVSRTMKYQKDTLYEAYNNLSEQYPGHVILGYDVKEDTYLELDEEYSVIFFCNPYKHLVHKFHEVEYFLDKNVLTLYMNYGFAALNFWDEVLGTDFYNYIWKACIETKSNYDYLSQHQKIRAKNALVTGYLKMDKLAQFEPSPKERKMIMICPHHTVWGWEKLSISNFLDYYNFFKELPQLYPDIDFVFRPHPLLFANLIAHGIWTQKQIDNYLSDMLKQENIIYDTDGDYLERFANSDAMIHDCGSFIGEYLYTEKPCCYMMKSEEQTMNGLLPLGQECMKQYYYAFSKEDICKFIDDVVINGDDPMREQREDFAKNTLKVNYPNSARFVTEYIKSKIS